MAAAVADALDHGGVLLAEAGTGTGKTLAYLVPAILNRQRVLISTGTKNLQEQIYFKDIPALRGALGVPFTATYMKGRANYLCLHRLTRVSRQASLRFKGERDTLDEITAWAAQSETGDKAELRTLPDDYAAWRDIDARADTCLGHRCDKYQECFVTRARQKAGAAEIVVVNHHLFFADLALRQQPNVELAHHKLSAWVYAPAQAIGDPEHPNGFQLFVKDEHWRSQYGAWVNAVPDEWTQVELVVGESSDPGSIDAGFDATLVTTLGLKISVGGSSNAIYTGPVYVDSVDW